MLLFVEAVSLDRVQYPRAVMLCRVGWVALERGPRERLCLVFPHVGRQYRERKVCPDTYRGLGMKEKGKAKHPPRHWPRCCRARRERRAEGLRHRLRNRLCSTTVFFSLVVVSQHKQHTHKRTPTATYPGTRR